MLYTGAGPKLVRKYFLPTDCNRHINPVRNPGLTAATNTLVLVYGYILLHVLIGYVGTSWLQHSVTRPNGLLTSPRIVRNSVSASRRTLDWHFVHLQVRKVDL